MIVESLINSVLSADDQKYIDDLVNLLVKLTENSSSDFVIKDGEALTKYDPASDTYTITLPLIPNEKVPVKSVDGKITFAYVDRKTMFVHELSHVALMLMNSNSELNNARLAAAISAAGDSTNIAAIKQNLSPTSTISPNASNASFENVFNNERNYYSNLTGTQEGDLYRTGYYSDGDGWTPPYI
ncbi:hypothetical protein, partial [Sulfuricurvum sp.]|uniref:hypothetical protein n=1 Tax=Sulfuricurvum sp. TaxID=2025608 RepID=UPI00261C8EF2